MNKTVILALAAFLFLAHAVEEYLSGFHRTDTILKWFSETLFLPQVIVWLLVQVVVFIFLYLLYKIRENPKAKILWFVLLVFCVIELSHPFTAFADQAYSPGLITSLFFIPLGWFVYKQLRRS
ncbi:HXXEE domain-containing protein [Patescibacteria group bacterium]|nr:HXXEE domain-containing protein [Patescibacteria group bacterium]